MTTLEAVSKTLSLNEKQSTEKMREAGLVVLISGQILNQTKASLSAPADCSVHYTTQDKSRWNEHTVS